MIENLFRFAGIGLLSTAAYFIVLNILVVQFDTPVMAATVLAYFVGFIVSWIGQSRYAFRDSQLSSAKLVKFALNSASGLLINSATMYALTERYGLHYNIAALIATALVAISSFVVMRFLIFAPER